MTAKPRGIASFLKQVIKWVLAPGGVLTALIVAAMQLWVRPSDARERNEVRTVRATIVKDDGQPWQGVKAEVMSPSELPRGCSRHLTTNNWGEIALCTTEAAKDLSYTLNLVSPDGVCVSRGLTWTLQADVTTQITLKCDERGKPDQKQLAPSVAPPGPPPKVPQTIPTREPRRTTLRLDAENPATIGVLDSAVLEMRCLPFGPRRRAQFFLSGDQVLQAEGPTRADRTYDDKDYRIVVSSLDTKACTANLDVELR